METQYKIRPAIEDDKHKIYTLLRENIATDKKIINPDLIPEGFMEEFVDKLIRIGRMLVVENSFSEMELIGEVHDYHPVEHLDHDVAAIKELSFFSRLDKMSGERETKLVNWLFVEIRNNYRDVFSVKINTPVTSSATVEFYKNLGLMIKGNYTGRLKNKPEHLNVNLPLSWINYS